MKEVLLGISAVIFIVVIVIEMVKESKKTENEGVKEKKDPMMEKLEFYTT